MEDVLPVDVRDPAALRAALDRIGLPIYVVAGTARIGPTVLGKIIAGQHAPSAPQAHRLSEALEGLLAIRRQG